MSSIARVERRVSLSNLDVRERNRITDDSIGTRSRPRTLIKPHEYFGTMPSSRYVPSGLGASPIDV